MSFVSGLFKVAKGAAVGVAAVTALPIFGAVGSITALGMVIGATVGAVAGVADEVIENKQAVSKKKAPRKRSTTP
ncbi:MAG TPA: hypothetical protein VN247_06290 [Arenimonas sp.]|nr:hypothetical protein [Arenimonas sp.]